MEHIVKRHGHRQKFDEKKVYGSVYAACLNTQIKEEKSEKIASNVTKDIKKWIKSKPTVTSDDIFSETIKKLKKYDKNASFMYETHRDIS